jgi:hypothetical protein
LGEANLEETAPFRVSWWVSVLPFSGAGLALAYRLISQETSIGPWSRPGQIEGVLVKLASLRQTVPGGPFLTDDLLALSLLPGLLSWQITAGLLAAVCIAAAGTALYTMVPPKASGFHLSSCWLALVTPLAVFSATFGYYILEPKTRHGVHGQLVQGLAAQARLPNLDLFENLIAAGCLSVAALLASACAVVLARAAKEQDAAQSMSSDVLESAAARLSGRLQAVNRLVYAGAVMLVVVTLEVKALLQWSLDSVRPLYGQSGTELEATKVIMQLLSRSVDSVTADLGVLNTLMLAGLYLPSVIYLRAGAVRLASRAVVVRAPADAGELSALPEVATWLQTHGLSFRLTEQLPRLIAVVAPALTGPIGELVGRLV